MPSWLSDAHHRLTRTGTGTRPPEPAEGTIDERTFRVHPTTGPALDGDVVWWLVEDTDLRLTEARGGPPGDQMYGDHRLRAALAECARMPAEAVVERVQMLAARWLGGSGHDDMAALAITSPTNNRGRLHLVDGHTARARAAQDWTEEEGA